MAARHGNVSTAGRTTPPTVALSPPTAPTRRWVDSRRTSVATRWSERMTERSTRTRPSQLGRILYSTVLVAHGRRRVPEQRETRLDRSRERRAPRGRRAGRDRPGAGGQPRPAGLCGLTPRHSTGGRAGAIGLTSIHYLFDFVSMSMWCDCTAGGVGETRRKIAGCEPVARRGHSKSMGDLLIPPLWTPSV